MLSTSSGDSTEQTNFINVETEPFTNPLQVESTENDKELPSEVTRNSTRKSNSCELASQMEKLEVSNVSVDLFSQFSSSSKFSLPPNRIVSNKENIDNISQRISNMNMLDDGDLADTQSQTPSQGKSKSKDVLADTQPNSSPIVLSSDGEDDDNNDGNNASLLTEETEDDDSVIEISSSDNSFEETDDRIPRNVSPINTQTEGITESVANKLNHFFDNIPKLNDSHNNYSKIVDLNSSKNGSATSEINVSETVASQLDENLDESGKLSNVESASEHASNAKDDNQKNETLNSSSDKADNTSLHRSSAKMSTVDDESDNQSVQNESNTTSLASLPLNQSTDEKQLSVHETKKKIEFERIKTGVRNVIKLNSPIINISAKVNINIQLSGFSSSSNSSETDGTSENADASEESSKNNDSILSETSINSSREFVADQCRRQFISDSNSNKIYFDSTKTNDREADDPHDNSNGISPDSSVIESSLIHSRGDGGEAIQNEENSTSGILEATSVLVDVAKELFVADASTSEQDERQVSVSPMNLSVEIDEIGEQLLTEVYGETWRTPQLVKKCLSTRKKCLTEVHKRNYTRGFSLFQSEVPSELESTRITPSGSERRENVCKPLDQLVSPNEQVTESNADQSSRITRSCRKVPGNRISDSDDDQSDAKESNADDSFEPVISSDEESDSSCEKVVKPKPVTARKRNQFVFLDLTCHEVIEDEAHENPDASADELAKVCEQFLNSLQTETVVQTPAPTNKKVTAITTKRKLFTPHYEEQIPFGEIETPATPSNTKNDKIIQLKTPIPSYLIPPQFRDRANIEGPVTPTIINSKENRTPRTPASSRVCGFLESLDDKLIPVEHCHPGALILRSKFKENRNELVKRLMRLFNDRVFDNKLKGVPVSWSKKLLTTAGICRNRKKGTVRYCTIELSEKVCTTADRVRDTLIHELCHASNWIIDKDGGHGKTWKYWTARAESRFPELPKIERCHHYDMNYKYTYKCTTCGLKSQARSKSKKVENIRCSACHGPIEVFLNKVEKDGTVTLVPPKEPSVFAKFVKVNYGLSKERGCSHADVMKILSNNFAKLTVAEKTKYK